MAPDIAPPLEQAHCGLRAPAFFEDVPPILMRDPLAQTLGACEDGLIEYRYTDAVKLAGHSCPTVAGAWLMTRAALARLYPGELPVRGELRVELRQRLDEGVAGVIASVATLVTGAANEGGFKGLGGRFGRCDLLRFGVPMQGEIRFTRLDTGRSAETAYHPEIVPRPPDLKSLMQAASAPDADAVTRKSFATAWQDWVRAILVDRREDPALVTVSDES
jgi:hypothetical protein